MEQKCHAMQVEVKREKDKAAAVLRQVPLKNVIEAAEWVSVLDEIGQYGHVCFEMWQYAGLNKNRRPGRLWLEKVIGASSSSSAICNSLRHLQRSRTVQ